MSYEEQRRLLVEKLKREGHIKTPIVERAFLRVPREEFVPPQLRHRAYEDTPLPIGKGQTISAPHMVAIMTELLEPRPGHKVLEVGTGSGYQAAILAEIVAPGEDKGAEGHVYTVERHPELAEFARGNLRRTGYADRVTVIVGDGSLGYPPEAPYDRIIVTAAAPRVPPPLLEQLKPGGRMVIPVGDAYEQRLYLVVKRSDGSVEQVPTTYCIFVPLVGKEGWPDDAALGWGTL